MPCVCLRFVIVVFPDHTHLLLLQNKTRTKRETPAKNESKNKQRIDYVVVTCLAGKLNAFY